ncbi:MAG: phosphocholine cytidylyltransferase family protein [Nevskia sp.]|nr:phosphocholine cytidylyltransferase family protein [Nevskia sp.]
MKAVILSAGQGRRLLPLTANRPKCLIELGGRSLLEWQLWCLAEAGIEEVVIVVGYGAEQVEAVLQARTPPGLSVRTLYNPFYEVADNLASCWMARSELRGECLILNGDTLIEPAIARRLLGPVTRPITVTIDRKPSYDADDMKIESFGDRLCAIGKQLSATTVNGESIGFLRFSAEGALRFVGELERIMRTPEGLKFWYLSVIDRIARASGDVGVLSIEGLGWGEMDFLEDVASNEALVADWLQPSMQRIASSARAVASGR